MTKSGVASKITPWGLILSVALVIVKYVAAPSMSWWVVTAPLWFPFSIIFLALALLGFFSLGLFAVTWILEKFEK